MRASDVAARDALVLKINNRQIRQLKSEIDRLERHQVETDAFDHPDFPSEGTQQQRAEFKSMLENERANQAFFRHKLEALERIGELLDLAVSFVPQITNLQQAKSVSQGLGI